MINSVARSPWGKSLVEFADKNMLSDDWDDAKDAGIEAHVTGWSLDNQNGSTPVVNGKLNDEFVVILKSPNGNCAVNLTDVLAMASAYVRDSYAKARRALSSKQSPLPNG